LGTKHPTNFFLGFTVSFVLDEREMLFGILIAMSLMIVEYFFELVQFFRVCGLIFLVDVSLYHVVEDLVAVVFESAGEGDLQ
jgi:hypothetical protein